MSGYSLGRKESTVGSVSRMLVLGYATFHLVELNKRGEDWAGLLALFAYVFFFVYVFKLTAVSQEFLTARLRFRNYKLAGKKLASGRYAQLEELQDAGLVCEQGVYMGEYLDDKNHEHDIRYNGQNTMLVLGPPEAKKTTSVAVSSLFPTGEQPDQLGIGHNVLLNDPNGETYAIMNPLLDRIGVRSYSVCPFHTELSEKLSMSIKDAGLHVWSDLDLEADPATIRSKVVDKAEILIPFEAKMDAKDKFFKLGGRTLCEFLQKYVIASKTMPTPSMLQAMIAEGPAGIIERCREATEYKDVLGGSLAKQAASILGYATTAPEQFAGYLGTCEEGLRLYEAEGVFGNHFTPKGVNPCVLKDEQPTVLFVCYQTNKASSHQPALNLTFTHIIEQLAADPRTSRRVTILMDETAGAGYLPVLASKAISEYRKFGIRPVLFFQELAGQAERIYGAHTVKEIIAACEVIWASNVREPSTLEMLSKKCGEIVVEDQSMNDARQFDPQFGRDAHFGRSHKTRPLLQPDEIRRMASENALVIAGNMHPIQLKKVPYWEREEWNKLAAKNPYRQV